MLGVDKDELLELGKQDETVEEIADTMIKLNKDGTFTRLISEEEEEKFFHNLEVNAARKEGKEEGLLEGKQEGALEDKKNIARNLLKESDMTIERIEKITGLTKEEILKIQENTDTETK